MLGMGRAGATRAFKVGTPRKNRPGSVELDRGGADGSEVEVL